MPRRLWWSAAVVLVLLILTLWVRWPKPEAIRPPRPADRPLLEQPAVEVMPLLHAPRPTPETHEVESPPIVFREAPPELVTVVVRDISTGKPVANLPLRSNNCGEVVGTTDADGRVHVEKQLSHSCEPTGHGWRALRTTTGDQWEPGTIWVYRALTVQGRVQALSSISHLDLTTVQLVLIAIGEEGGAGVIGRPRLDVDWFLRQKLDQVRHLADVSEDGFFNAEVPRIPGYAICAQAAGWQPDSSPVDARCDPCQVALILKKPALSLSGSVKTVNGKPLSGITVSCFVTVRMRADEVRQDEIRGKGYGYKLRVSRKEGWATLTYLLSAKTQDDGSYQLSSNVTGELTLFVSPPGGENMQTTILRAGALSQDRSDLDIVVRHGDGSRVQLLRNGVPLANCTIVILDQSCAEQPGVRLGTDERGEFPASAVIAGHKLGIRVDGIPGFGYRHLVWQGEHEVDLEKLPRLPPWPLPH